MIRETAIQIANAAVHHFHVLVQQPSHTIIKTEPQIAIPAPNEALAISPITIATATPVPMARFSVFTATDDSAISATKVNKSDRYRCTWNGQNKFSQL